MVAANGVPEMVVAEGTVRALQTCRWAKEGHVRLSVKDWRNLLLEKLELSGLGSWMEENKEKALHLLVEYHDIFALEDGEMGCTKAAEHKIKVMDPKPFKERPQNIPTGLLDEVKEHLDHRLEVGVIKPSKLAGSNAIVLFGKRMDFLMSPNVDATEQRWINELAKYDFSLKYQKGKTIL